MNATSERSRWQFQKNQEKCVIDFEPAFSCDNFYVLQQLAIDGLGITQLPDYMGEKHVERGGLIRVLQSWPGPKVEIYALVRSARGVTPKIRVFLDFLSQNCNVR